MGIFINILEKVMQPKILENIWERRVEGFKRYNGVVEKGGIVLLGDSITEGFNVNEIYSGKSIINRGISGDTTAGVIKRIDESVYALQPEKVFILIGTNDIARPKYKEEKTVQNIREIIEGINSNCTDVKTYIQSVYPVNGGIENANVEKRTNPLIDSLNEQIAAVAQKCGAEYLDTAKILADTNGNLNSEYTYDGLHLSGKGYEKVLGFLLPYIE